jgi:hypothetical protein
MMKVETYNITKVNDVKINILYPIIYPAILIKLTKPLSSLNNIAFSRLELLYLKI